MRCLKPGFIFALTPAPVTRPVKSLAPPSRCLRSLKKTSPVRHLPFLSAIFSIGETLQPILSKILLYAKLILGNKMLPALDGQTSCEICQGIRRLFTAADSHVDEPVNRGSLNYALSTNCETHEPLLQSFAGCVGEYDSKM